MRSEMKRIAGCIAICLGALFVASAQQSAFAQEPANLPYMNPQLSPEQRAADLVRRMTLEEKATQMQNNSAAVERLKVPAYQWWSEALHGVINEGAPTAALHELMDVRSGDVVLEKPRFGSFYGTDLEVILRSSGIDTIIVGGINTNVCVDTTAREAAVREFRVLFLSDGTANFDLPDGGLGAASAEELQRAACAVMAFGFADVVTVDEVLDRIPVAASS